MASIEQEVRDLAGFDYYNLDERLTPKQQTLRDRIREYVQDAVLPNINPYWEKAEFPRDIVMKMKDLGIMGGTLTEHGAAGLDFTELGLVMYEMAKGDGSVVGFYGIQTGLVLNSIGMLGSEEQKARWMPALVNIDKIGSFGLTEPKVGSNAGQIQTTAKKDGDSYLLNGAKRWIGNASMADILIIWARDEDGKFGGFVIEDPQTTEGVTVEDIWGKVSIRAIRNGHITLDNVRVPAENRLEKVTSFKQTSHVLSVGRFGVAWGAAGAAAGAFEHALKYAKEREQFGKPIAAFQLIQQKLVEMATEVTLMQALCFQLTDQLHKGQMTEGMVSMAKYNNARKMRYVTSLAREVLGGNGILIDNHIARLWTDAEGTYTYEGTNEVNLLLVGRDLTGINAIVS